MYCSQLAKVSQGKQCLQIYIFQIKRHLQGQRFKFIYRRFYNTIRAVENSLALEQYDISKEKSIFSRHYILCCLQQRTGFDPIHSLSAMKA